MHRRACAADISTDQYVADGRTQTSQEYRGEATLRINQLADFDRAKLPMSHARDWCEECAARPILEQGLVAA